MHSLNRHVVQERIALVVDTSVGSNGTEQGIKGHLRSLRAAVDLPDPNAKGPEAFKRAFARKGK